MSKSRNEPTVYCVVQDNFVWHGKRHRTGAMLEILTRSKADKGKLALHLKKCWLRVATPGDRQQALTLLSKSSAPTPPQAAPTETASPGQVQDVALGKIRPDPTQPRKEFSPESMKELVDSIKDLGVQQAIQLRPMSRWRQLVSFVARQWVKRERKDEKKEWLIEVGNFWRDGLEISAGELMPESPIIQRLVAEGRIQVDPVELKGFVPVGGALEPLTGEVTMPGEAEWLEIVYGERRWRGSKEAGVATIPAKVNELSDIHAADLQAIENLKRANLLPLEDAAQYRKLIDTPGYGLTRVMATTGKAKNTIYGKLKLLDLPDEAKAAVQAAKLGQSTAERIGRLTGDVQAKAIKAILHPQQGYGTTDAGVLTDAYAKQAIQRIEQDEVRDQARAAIKADAKARGLIWLERDTKPYAAVYGYSFRPLPASGLIELDQNIDGDGEGRTFRQVLAKKPFKAVLKEIKPTMATLRNEALVELYEAAGLRAALKQAGLELSNRKAPVDNDEAFRRRRDKRMKAVIGTAALVISAKAQALTPRVTQNAETEAMWRALALGAVGAMGNDDLRAFVKRRDLPLVLDEPYSKGEKGRPDFSATAEQFIATQPTSVLAGIVAELLLVRGAWWSHNLDFSRTFRRDAAVFGVELHQLKIEAGASEEEVAEEEASNRKFNDEEDDRADVRTEAGELLEQAA